jgi:hypothetical protein
MVFNQKIASIGLTGFFGAVFVAAAPQLSVGLLATYGLISTALGFGIAAISKAVGDAFPEDNSTPPDSEAPPPPYSGNGLPPVNPLSQPMPEPVFRPSIPNTRRTVIRPFFQNIFAKPTERVVDRRIEVAPIRIPSAPPPPLPSAPPQFVPVPPPVAIPVVAPKPASTVISRTIEAHQPYPTVISTPFFTVTPSVMTFSKKPVPVAPKPAPQVVSHTIEASRPSAPPVPRPPAVTFRQSIPAATPIVSRDPSHKPAAKVMGHTIVSSGQPVSVPNIASSDPSDKPAPKIIGRSIQPRC